MGRRTDGTGAGEEPEWEVMVQIPKTQPCLACLRLGSAPVGSEW